MSETASDPPPPYPGTGPGFEQNSTLAVSVGQTNYGFSAPQYPAYIPPPQQHIVRQQHTNIVIAQISGGDNVYRSEPLPVDYTSQAWIACLCCFWPTGLVAIMKATESRDALARGDLTGAHIAAEGARNMIKISLAAGIISLIVLIFIIVVTSAS
ncbi:proline-rich transmembrane protein 1-like [Mercenaria mercenaria]|uniref:proline-rich transmembrane protein 1-like n=1 Tax=Mercenaria mercenaria TaxID=6596 RepID=UPI001E1D767F|nr:proline-rich transmembrane protein 1-like [Mercenaria mercenaria]